jgi:hypothetical protein
LGTLASGDTAIWSEAFNTKNVGTGKTLIPTGTVNDGNGGANYSVTFANNTMGEITVKTLTVSATGTNKIYDGTTAATVTLSDNRVAGDVFTDSYTDATFADKDVGAGKTIYVSGISISGTDAANYILSSTTAVTTADIISEGHIATWTGLISTDWNTAGNWNIGRAPVFSDDVIIPSTINKPICSNDVTVTSLTVNAGETLSTGGHSLTVNGNFKLQGTLNAGGSSVTVGGNLETDSTGKIQGMNVALVVNGYIGTRYNPINVDITGTLTVKAGGMNDLVSVSLNGAGNCSYGGSIPGFVFMNRKLVSNVGQANFRSSLETGESVSYRALPAPQPSMVPIVTVPFGVMAITPAGPMPTMVAPMPLVYMPAVWYNGNNSCRTHADDGCTDAAGIYACCAEVGSIKIANSAASNNTSLIGKIIV